MIKFNYRRLSKIVQRASICPLPDSPTVYIHLHLFYSSLSTCLYMHNFSEFWREVGDLMSLFLYLSMYFPRTKAYSYTNNFSTVAKIQKFSIAARLLCNSQSIFKLHQLPQQCALQRFPTPPPFTPGSGASLGSLSSQALYRRLWFHFDILLKAVWKLFFFFF